ncbi:MAG TPA: protein translocase subunit SecF [Patescibacteria group bacterium]|nr:protein translocase subunit SecF [Patescibacteria group bacterium]
MAGFRFRIVKDKTDFNFMGVHKFTFALSALMTVAVVFLLFTKGLNLGIDFTGGVLMEVKPPAGMHIDKIRSALHGMSHGSPTIQEFGQDAVLVKIPGREADAATQKAINAEVQQRLPGAEFRRVEYVGPHVGSELISAGITAFVYSMIGILGYIWVRFEWQFGVVAVFALAHDMLATLLFFLVTQIEFDLSTVAAALLVAGYSINETVVVFDRIREMLRKYRRTPMPEVVNLSINDVLGRTLMTTLTTFMSMAALCIFGGEGIKGFTYAMLVGILFGPYSSMFFSAPLLTYLNVRRGPDEAGEKRGRKLTEQKA